MAAEVVQLEALEALATMQAVLEVDQLQQEAAVAEVVVGVRQEVLQLLLVRGSHSPVVLAVMQLKAQRMD